MKNSASSPSNFSQNDILNLLKKHARPMRLDGILRLGGIKRQQKKNLLKMLDALESEGRIIRFPGGLYALTENMKKVTGVYSQHPSGGGVVVPHGNGPEIRIPAHHTGDAWHMDSVQVLLEPGSKGSKGKIAKIIERNTQEAPARIVKREGSVFLCRPLDRHLEMNFSIMPDPGFISMQSVKVGALVMLKPEEKLADNLWKASLINIFGAENNISAQEALVKSSHHVPGQFPALALEQTQSLPDAPDEKDFSGRQDMRHVPFVTIDGADARDFDDAIYVEETPSGYLLKVAIADVSHYVRPDSREGSLDEEALKRGNSWYFPNSVEPMLPKVLSNGLCSLKPAEDRLAMLVELPVSWDGIAGQASFSPIIMRSQARLIYDDVYDFFQSGQLKISSGVSVNGNLEKMLANAYKLYQILASARHKRGMLDFDLPEAAYKFDAKGQLVSMGTAPRNDAHKLIEEFMIAANEAVAFYLAQKNLPFLFRTHPAPELLKLNTLFETLRTTAIESVPSGLTPESLANPLVLQQILEKAAHTPQEYAVNRLCLRAMNQARYQPENLGHFGLASKYYCHFTSPIRRYADLLTHRALKVCLGKENYSCPDAEKLWEIGDKLNKLEREAMDCEREMARRLGCLAMQGHEGEIFKGSISGVTDFGVFVELVSPPVEGLARIRELAEGWIEYNQDAQTLTEQGTHKTWRLGDPIEVVVEAVNMDRMEIRLRPAHAINRKPKPVKLRKYAANHPKNESAPAYKRKNKPIPGEKKTKKSKNMAAGSKTRNRPPKKGK